jgi:hypothetical protein
LVAYPKEESKSRTGASYDESEQNIPDRFDAAGFEWLQNEILNDLQRRVDTSPEFEMRQAFQRAGSDVARTFALMRRAIHIAALSSIRVPDGSVRAEAPKEDAVGELKIELKEFVVDKPRRYSIWINDREYPNKRAGIVDAISLFDAADKWASGTSGGSRIAIVTADFAPSGYLDFATAVKTDVEGVYVWSDTYRVSEFICHSAPKEILPEGAPQAISYNVQFAAKLDSTPNSEECKKHFEQAVMRACRERFDEQP